MRRKQKFSWPERPGGGLVRDKSGTKPLPSTGDREKKGLPVGTGSGIFSDMLRFRKLTFKKRSTLT